MRKFSVKLSKLIISLFTIVAVGSMATGSSCFLHQVKEPESLRKKSEI